MASAFDHDAFDDHESVHLFADRQSGLKAIIAVHSTHLGPAAGGTRFWHYPRPGDALADALRLSRAMSFKNAMAGLPLGGGKAVILADGNGIKTEDQLAAYGRAIESLQGAYVTAEDVGISGADMIQVARHTRYVSCLPAAPGRAGGDPSPYTGYGVYLGMKAATQRMLDKPSLAGLRILVQGAGAVARAVAGHAALEGANLVIADIDGERSAQLAADIGGTVADPERLLELEADLLCPCALGGILSEEAIARLNVPIIAGGANNQLETDEDGARLQARGILYAPDYVINAGGIINVASEYLGLSDEAGVNARIHQIPGRLEEIWERSDLDDRDPASIADQMASALIGRSRS